MGATASTPGLEPLNELAGADAVSADDAEFWADVFALRLPSSSAEEIAAASFAFCTEMERNNPRSGNLTTLIRKCTELLGLAAKPRAKTVHVQQASCCVFLLRLFLKHMIEHVPPHELDAQLCGPAGTAGAYSAQAVVAPFVEALLIGEEGEGRGRLSWQCFRVGR